MNGGTRNVLHIDTFQVSPFLSYLFFSLETIYNSGLTQSLNVMRESVKNKTESETREEF
jgi:hypothetical protein